VGSIASVKSPLKRVVRAFFRGGGGIFGILISKNDIYCYISWGNDKENSNLEDDD